MVRIKHRYLLVHILYPESSDLHEHTPTRPSLKATPDLVHFHRPSPDYLTPQLLGRTIKDQVLLLYGDYGLGLVSNGLAVKYLSPATSTAIIRCPRAHYRLVWAALSFMTELPKPPKQAQPRVCAMQVLRVSGTIKKVEEEAIARARAAILRAKRESDVGSIDSLMAFMGQADDSAVAPDHQVKTNQTPGSDESMEEGEAMESVEDG